MSATGKVQIWMCVQLLLRPTTVTSRASVSRPLRFTLSCGSSCCWPFWVCSSSPSCWVFCCKGILLQLRRSNVWLQQGERLLWHDCSFRALRKNASARERPPLVMLQRTKKAGGETYTVPHCSVAMSREKAASYWCNKGVKPLTWVW